MARQWSVTNRKQLASHVETQAKAIQRFRLPESHFDLESKGRREVVKAIYNALLEQHIQYDLEEYLYSDTTQMIRTPEEVLSDPSEGTCLDLATVFCALCLRYRLLPLLIVLEDHALVAVSLNHGREEFDGPFEREELHSFSEGLLPEEELEKLRELVDGGAYLAIECTGFAQTHTLPKSRPEGIGRNNCGVLPFERAALAGREQLHLADRPFKYALDIAVLQDLHRILPPHFQPIDGISDLWGSDLSRPDYRSEIEYLISFHTQDFVGRKEDLDFLLDWVAKESSGYLLVEAPAG